MDINPRWSPEPLGDPVVVTARGDILGLALESALGGLRPLAVSFLAGAASRPERKPIFSHGLRQEHVATPPVFIYGRLKKKPENQASGGRKDEFCVSRFWANTSSMAVTRRYHRF